MSERKAISKTDRKTNRQRDRECGRQHKSSPRLLTVHAAAGDDNVDDTAVVNTPRPADDDEAATSKDVQDEDEDDTETRASFSAP